MRAAPQDRQRRLRARFSATLIVRRCGERRRCAPRRARDPAAAVATGSLATTIQLRPPIVIASPSHTPVVVEEAHFIWSTWHTQDKLVQGGLPELLGRNAAAGPAFDRRLVDAVCFAPRDAAATGELGMPLVLEPLNPEAAVVSPPLQDPGEEALDPPRLPGAVVVEEEQLWPHTRRSLANSGSDAPPSSAITR